MRGLLKHHADPNIKKTFPKNGADRTFNSNIGVTALMLAASGGYTETVETLLKYGADINAKDKNGYTALMWAVTKGHTETVRVLLKHHADPNISNKSGITALMLAANYPKIANIFNEFGVK